jgi:hypothetical protein
MNELLLDKASDFTYAQLKLFGGDINRLAIPVQTVAVINSAQGVIDNGGLEYFFESDFDGAQNIPFLSKFTVESALRVPHPALKSLLLCFLLRSRIYTSSSGSNG